ncbi:hypothetical protein CCS92_08630 [Methylobacterium radiotolerans]|nr:hypothetical protein CCS92_08630 [Methylobacterium radiotolerans]
MTGKRFGAYVSETLVPALRPGDTLILDNLGAHKVAGVREAIEAAKAWLLYSRHTRLSSNRLNVHARNRKRSCAARRPAPMAISVRRSTKSSLPDGEVPQPLHGCRLRGSCLFFRLIGPCRFGRLRHCDVADDDDQHRLGKTDRPALELEPIVRTSMQWLVSDCKPNLLQRLHPEAIRRRPGYRCRWRKGWPA